MSLLYDPVESGLARSWKSSGNDTTGLSLKIPVAKLLSSLNELVPVKAMGVLYTPHEKNSEALLKVLSGLQDEFRIRIIPIPLTREEDTTVLLPEVLRVADAIYFNQMAEDLGARTGELLDAQEELVRKEKLAFLGQLSGSVGHELRPPPGVTVCLGNSYSATRAMNSDVVSGTLSRHLVAAGPLKSRHSPTAHPLHFPSRLTLIFSQGLSNPVAAASAAIETADRG